MNPLFDRLLDDAAVFPPGNLPLAEAVPAYLRHKQSSYADLVGPFVVAPKHLDELREVTAQLPVDSLSISLTVPIEHMVVAQAMALRIPAVALDSIELTMPADLPVDHYGSRIQDACFDEEPHREPLDPAIAALPIVGERRPCILYVEVARDDRRDTVVRDLGGYAPYRRAKFRTGGVTADLYPDETELAESILSAVRHAVPFKATAGLHHAIRNTDPTTGFEQHGFLNLLIATAKARAGAKVEEVVEALAERDPSRIVAGVRDLSNDVRDSFCSFGTCSIAEPVDELCALGLLPVSMSTQANPGSATRTQLG